MTQTIASPLGKRTGAVASELLRVEDLRTYFGTPHGIAKAVDSVSFTVNRGETRAIVGESGCGKSITSLSILQLVPEPAGYIESGQILFEGRDLLDLTWEQMRAVRGKDIAMIFQEPMTSLNAVMKVGRQLTEAMELHETAKGQAARTRATDLLARVGLPDPKQVMNQYPHELSGGMRQRVMIAMALSNNPKLLVADEPTTALDVTVQAQILDLMRELQSEFGMAILLITHDLGIVARMAHDVTVMYAGQVIEDAPTRDLFRNPRHPYTQGLFASLPTRKRRGVDLSTMEGVVPQATNWPPACRFEPRCPYHWQTCKTLPPKAWPKDSDRPVRCHLYDPESDRPMRGVLNRFPKIARPDIEANGERPARPGLPDDTGVAGVSETSQDESATTFTTPLGGVAGNAADAAERPISTDYNEPGVADGQAQANIGSQPGSGQ